MRSFPKTEASAAHTPALTAKTKPFITFPRHLTLERREWCFFLKSDLLFMQQVGLQSLPWELHREILSWLPLVPDRLGSCARINKLWNKNAHEFLEELDLSPYVDNLSDSIIVYLSSKCTKLHTLKIYSINYPKIDSFFGRDDLSLYRRTCNVFLQKCSLLC